jgi:hypothetical protein
MGNLVAYVLITKFASYVVCGLPCLLYQDNELNSKELAFRAEKCISLRTHEGVPDMELEDFYTSGRSPVCTTQMYLDENGSTRTARCRYEAGNKM